MFKGSSAKNLGILEKDIITPLIASVSGKELKGWPEAVSIYFMERFTPARTYLTKKEIVIASGWRMDAILRIPISDVLSVSTREIKPSFQITSKVIPYLLYTVTYKTSEGSSTLKIYPEPDMPYKNLLTTKTFFERFVKK
jgi:hypothetical protein